MVDIDNHTNYETHDGKGAGDHDKEYIWGNPMAGLNAWARLHLTVMKSDIIDHVGAIVGDSDYIEAEQRPSGIFVPTPPVIDLSKFWLTDDGPEAA